MAWTVEISNVAERQLQKLARPAQERILGWRNERIEGCKNPRHFGEPLRGDRTGFWRYRIGDYRVLRDIQDKRVIVLILTIGHRRRVYKH